MAKDPKIELGKHYCHDCGDVGSVYGAGGKRSGYLYLRCGCGTLQGHGVIPQSRYWHDTDWNDGLKPEIPPPNALPLEEYNARIGAVSKPVEAEPETVVNDPLQNVSTDADPATEPEAETESGAGDPDNQSESEASPPPESASTGGGKGMIALGLAAAGLLLAGLAKVRG